MPNPQDQLEDIIWYATHSVVNPAVLRDMIYSLYVAVLNSNSNSNVDDDETGSLPAT